MNHPQVPKNNEVNFIYDYRTGDVINPLTGEVVERIYVQDYYYRDSETDMLIPTHETPKLTDPMHPLFLARTTYESLTEILDYLGELRKEVKLPVSDYEVEMTARFVLKKLGRHPHTHVFNIAVLYIALERLNALTIDDKTFAEVYGVSWYDLKSEIIKLKSELVEAGVVKKEVGSIVNKIATYINTYGKMLDLPRSVIVSAVKVASSKPYPSRFTPRSLAAAILFMEITRHNIDITSRVENTISPLKALMKALNMSPALAKAVKFVKEYYYGEGEKR